MVSKFERGDSAKNLMVSSMSFGYKNGVPLEADLVFDVRFLPNPHFIPEFRPLTGKHPKVARYVRGFPQTTEFLDRTTELLALPAAALYPGREELPDRSLRLHRRPTPLRDDCRRDEEALAKEGYRIKVSHRGHAALSHAYELPHHSELFAEYTWLIVLSMLLCLFGLMLRAPGMDVSWRRKTVRVLGASLLALTVLMSGTFVFLCIR